MNKKALFCDGTGNYVFPPEPLAGQQVTLQFRTGAGEADQVFLITESQEYEMEKRSTSGVFIMQRSYSWEKTDSVTVFGL